MNLEIIFNNQQAIIILICAFMIGGIFKSQSLFLPLFSLIVSKTKSKRLSLLSISLLAGILPVEGRVSISAPILDSIVQKEEAECCDKPVKARSKIGILDYIATHHYYLWSPLEKSIIILMAGLSLTYVEILKYTAFPLFLYIVYLVSIIFFYIEEKDIFILGKKDNIKYSWKSIFIIIPFISGIVLSIFYPPHYIFPLVTIFYYSITYKFIPLNKLLSFIKWKTLLIVFFIILVANLIKSNQDAISSFLNLNHLESYKDPNLILVSSLIASGALLSFILGSSSKYAGICVALTLALGIKYLPIILMVEYCAYLLSPTHKCIAISVSYFETRVFEFYKLLCGLALLMFISGLIQFKYLN